MDFKNFALTVLITLMITAVVLYLVNINKIKMMNEYQKCSDFLTTMTTLASIMLLLLMMWGIFLKPN